MIERIRVSSFSKDQLVALKRATGIAQWNILCRWAFMTSLSDPTRPVRLTRAVMENGGLLAEAAGEVKHVELFWSDFDDSGGNLYWALLKERCLRDGVALDEATLEDEFRLHLYRGIAWLSGNVRSLDALVAFALDRGARAPVPAS